MSLLRGHFAELPTILNDAGYMTRLYNGCLPVNPPAVLSDNGRTAWRHLRTLIEMLDNKVVNNTRVREVNLKVNRFFCLYEHLRTQVREHDWSRYPLSIPAPLEQAVSTYQATISPSLVVAQTQKLWKLYTRISPILKTQSMIQDSESRSSADDDELGHREGRGRTAAPPSLAPMGSRSQSPPSPFGGVSNLPRPVLLRSTSVPRISPVGSPVGPQVASPMVSPMGPQMGAPSGPRVVQR